MGGGSSSGISYGGSGLSGTAQSNARNAVGKQIRENAKDQIRDTSKRTERKDDKISQKNVFISFHMEDELQVKLLRHQSKDDAFDLKFRDYSIKEPFDSKWKTQTLERIKQTSATVVMIGEDTHNREAVDWEIKKSLELGKKVIGVRIYKDANHKIPELMKEHNCKIIEWKMKEISDSISED